MLLKVESGAMKGSLDFLLGLNNPINACDAHYNGRHEYFGKLKVESEVLAVANTKY